MATATYDDVRGIQVGGPDKQCYFPGSPLHRRFPIVPFVGSGTRHGVCLLVHILKYEYR